MCSGTRLAYADLAANQRVLIAVVMCRLVADAFNMLGNAQFLASQNEENPIRKSDKVRH